MKLDTPNGIGWQYRATVVTRVTEPTTGRELTQIFMADNMDEAMAWVTARVAECTPFFRLHKVSIKAVWHNR